MKHLILAAVLYCGLLLPTLAQHSFKSTTTIFPYYRVEVTNHSTGKSQDYHQEGIVTISLDQGIITVSRSGASTTDTFLIDRVKKWRVTSVDTGFTVQCSGGKERLKFVSCDIVDRSAFGYKALLNLVYFGRTVSYYMGPGFDINKPSPRQLKRTENKPPAINEIDRLYKKYKGMDSAFITNAYGTFMTYIIITFNEAGKPKTIVMKGLNENAEVVEHFVKNLIADRKAKGYVLQPPSSPYNGDIYEKGPLYTRIYTYAIHQEDGSRGILFEIENGDIIRIAGPKATNADF
jgi:hypothetical protein